MGVRVRVRAKIKVKILSNALFKQSACHHQRNVALLEMAVFASSSNKPPALPRDLFIKGSSDVSLCELVGPRCFVVILLGYEVDQALESINVEGAQ